MKDSPENQEIIEGQERLWKIIKNLPLGSFARQVGLETYLRKAKTQEERQRVALEALDGDETQFKALKAFLNNSAERNEKIYQDFLKHFRRSNKKRVLLMILFDPNSLNNLREKIVEILENIQTEKLQTT